MMRQKIVTALIDELQKISIENGFYTDGLSVFEWLDKPLEESEYPAVIVRDAKDDMQDNIPLEHRLRVEIDIALQGRDVPINLRDILSDVLRAVGNFEKKNNYDTTLVGNEFLIEHKDSIYGGVRVEIDIVYYTDRWMQ